MKKTLFSVIVMLVATCGFAAYQYDDVLKLNGTSLSVQKNANLTLNFSQQPWQSNINQWAKLTTVSTKPDGTVTKTTVDITGDKVNIGKVAEGDQIKFFLTNSKGETTQDNMTFWGSGWDTGKNTYEYLHFGANYGNYGSQYSQFQFQISPSEPPVGQPLPGVGIILLIGGGIIGAIALKKKLFSPQHA